MAKVTLPLLSGSASGKIAKALVFFGWLGRDVVRQWLIPGNPKSNDQAEARTYLGAVGKNNKMIESLSQKDDGDSVLYTQILAKTPADQTWMSYFAKTQIGTAAADIKAAITAYGILNTAKKALWTAAAATIPLTGFDVGYGIVEPIAAGEQLFISATGAFALGLAIAPDAPSGWTVTDITAFAAAYKYA